MRKSFIKIRPAKPWERLSQKALETQLLMFRDKWTSHCEDSGSPQGPPGACSALLVQRFPVAKLPWVYAEEGEGGDESYLRTGVSDRHGCDILTLLSFLLSQGTRTLPPTPPPPTSLQIILWAPNTYSSPLLPLQMRNVSSASSPRHASLCLWQPLTALSPPYPHIPLPKCSPTPPHWAVPVPISSQKG